jgi:hypothetical protein
LARITEVYAQYQYHVTASWLLQQLPNDKEAILSNARRPDGKSWNIPNNIQTAIMANHKPNEKGVYPDWADTKITFSNIEKSKLSICSKYTAMPPFTGFKTGTP